MPVYLIIFLLLIYTFYLVLVKIFVLFYNPQITKARIHYLNYILYNDFIYKSNITLNKGLSMLVGISEAICLLFFNLHYIFNYNIKFYLNKNIIKSKNKLNLIFNKNFSTLPNNNNNNEIVFNQWLVGLIDGDGCFQLSKKKRLCKSRNSNGNKR